MEKATVGLVLFEVALLAGVLAFVDDTLIRVGLGFVPAMLLAQRALDITPGPGEIRVRGVGGVDRRRNHLVRDYVDVLLQRVREFYAACHLLRSRQISQEEATERIHAIEQDLDRILGEVTRASRIEIGTGEAA